MLLSKNSAQNVYLIPNNDGNIFLKNSQDWTFAQFFFLSHVSYHLSYSICLVPIKIYLENNTQTEQEHSMWCLGILYVLEFTISGNSIFLLIFSIHLQNTQIFLFVSNSSTKVINSSDYSGFPAPWRSCSQWDKLGEALGQCSPLKAHSNWDQWTHYNWTMWITLTQRKGKISPKRRN